jgi:ornithine cyclodeaminase
MLKTLVLGADDVSEMLTMAECIDVMESTFRSMSKGLASFPPRNLLALPDKKGVLGMMPGYLTSQGIIGLKATSVFPGNLGTPYESHQGAVLIFETTNGKLLGVVDAASVTRIRTAAASGVATNLLAREATNDLCIIGSGVQASSHLEAMLLVRPSTKRVRVFSRNPENAKAFARKESSSSRGITVEATGGAQDAIAEADLICTTTGSTSPIVLGKWVRPGAHINAVGASRPPGRELDSDLVARSRLYVDSRESANLEADDFRVPRQEGRIGDSHIRGEIGEVLEGKATGRTGPDDITVFKSLGLAIEDLAAANFLYEKALRLGRGKMIEFGGLREARG